MAQAFDQLLEKIKACRVCRDEPRPRAKPLPHEPRPVVLAHKDAKILISGQAPGTRVHKSGKPFTDPSGDRLRDWLGVDDETFYDPTRIAIVPMGFCFPGLDAKGGDLPPRKECAPLWHDQVIAGLTSLKLVLIIGMYAQEWHLKDRRKRTLTDTVAAWRDYADDGNNPKILPLPHPSWRNNVWIKKNPWFEDELLPYLRAQVAALV